MKKQTKKQGVISLPVARIHKKEEIKRLKNLPSNFTESFYKDWVDGIDFSHDTGFHKEIVNNSSIKDVKKYLLPTSEFGQVK